MRRTFADTLLLRMADNKDIFLLTGDLGYKVFEEHFEKFPLRCINMGAAEQTMLDAAVGMAYDGKIPFCYSITTFLLYRGFETLRTYINHEDLGVKLIGSGRNQDYAHDGISHWSDDAGLVLKALPNIVTHWPEQKEDIPNIVDLMIKDRRPHFLSLRR